MNLVALTDTSLKKHFRPRAGARWLGLTNYNECLLIQREKVEEVLAEEKYENTHHVILGTEHETVITLGRRASPAEEVVDATVPVIAIERGGLATLHSPGQLVIYPILSLHQRGLSVREWVSGLLTISRRVLERHGMAGLTQTEDAIVSPIGKIVSVGIRVDRGVSYHGVSINVANDLGLFGMIRACGQSNRPLDKLSRVDPLATPSQLFQEWEQEFIAFDFRSGSLLD